MFSLFCQEIYIVAYTVFSILSGNIYCIKPLNVYCLLLGILLLGTTCVRNFMIRNFVIGTLYLHRCLNRWIEARAYFDLPQENPPLS